MRSLSKKEIFELFIEEIWDAIILKAWTQIIAEGYEPKPRHCFGLFSQTTIDHKFN